MEKEYKEERETQGLHDCSWEINIVYTEDHACTCAHKELTMIFLSKDRNQLSLILKDDFYLTNIEKSND